MSDAEYGERDRLMREQVAALREVITQKDEVIASGARIEALTDELNANYLAAIEEAWEAIRFETTDAAERAAAILRATLDAAELEDAE